MEFAEVTVKESPGLCRCCLSEGCYKDLGTEYSWMNDTEVYADMLLDCFDIGITQHNDGPNGPKRLICEVCITRLRDACNFKKQVVDSEKKFIDMLGRGDFRSMEKQTVLLPIYSSAVPMKAEAIEEVTVAEDYDDSNVEFLDDNDCTEDEDLVKHERKAHPTPSTSVSKRGRPKKNEEPPEKKPKLKAKTKIAKGAKFNTEDKYKKMELAQKLLLKRRNVEYILQYSNVTPFMWHKSKYKCFYCSEAMRDPTCLRQHSAEEHENANLELIIYDRTRNNRNKDAAIKIDVTDICCKLCPQPLNSLEELIHHIIIAHDAEYDVNIPNCVLPFKLDKDTPTCASCDCRFVFFEYLLRHANKHHLSHQFVCDVCGTSFQGENHLKMHHRYYHREGGYICDTCGVSLATLSKKILHEKNVHSVNLYTCPNCPVTFKSPYQKKLHLANDHGVEELKIKCTYCSKVFPQESIMSRHMRRVHLRQKNVECEVCGDKFFSPYDVKLHMLKHNGDKKFICSGCGKKFSKKSNLNSHMALHEKEKISSREKNSCDISNRSFAQDNLKMRSRSTQIDEDFSLLEQNESDFVNMEMEVIEDGLNDDEITEFIVQGNLEDEQIIN